MPSTVTVTTAPIVPVPVPLMTIGMPPPVDPMFGRNSLMTGGPTYVYPPNTLTGVWPGARITATATVPAA